MSDEKSINIGWASHIHAASPKGPRFDASMTRIERRAVSNGIWMCAGHGVQIDAEEAAYTADELRLWKAAAEQHARDQFGVPRSLYAIATPLSFDLAETSELGTINHRIGTMLARCGLEIAWGMSERECIQDLLIEIGRNALQHGGATAVTVQIEPDQIIVADDGKRFDPLSLKEGLGRGGAKAVATLRERHPEDLVVRHRYEADGTNLLSIARLESLSDGAALDPCCLKVTVDEIHAGLEIGPEQFSRCGDVMVILPKYMSLSDAYKLGPALAKAFGVSARLHLLLEGASRTTLSILELFVPFARFFRKRDERRSTR